MSALKEALARMIWLQNENIKTGGGLFDVYGSEYMDAIHRAAKSDAKETWDVFRNGTDDEFITLVDELGHLGRKFENDDTLKEIMQIGRARLSKTNSTDDFFNGLKVGFGDLFEQFWNETEPEPLAKAQTFTQVLRRTDKIIKTQKTGE